MRLPLHWRFGGEFRAGRDSEAVRFRTPSTPRSIWARACHGRARSPGGPVAPQDRPWMWSLAYGYHRDRTPSYGYEPTREAAMAAFAKSWRRE